MLLLIKFLAKIFSVLNGEVSSRQIAAGFAFGAMIGLVPIGLLPTALLIFAFVININLAMMGLASLIFKIIAFVLDPVASQLGFALLRSDGLKGLWTQLYNMPLVPYTRFNNTLVLGSLVIGLLLLVPLYLGCKSGVDLYRRSLREKVRNSKFMKALTASTFYKYYVTFRDIRGQ